MQKFLWLLSILTVLNFPAQADESLGALPKAAAETQKKLPQCSDEKLKEQVEAKITSFFENTPRLSLIERRHRQLLLRNLRSFSEIPPAEFDKKENFAVADKMLMAKINDGLNDEDLRLCRSTSGGRVSPVYLLIRPENYQVIVDILNFLPGSSANSDFFIIYE